MEKLGKYKIVKEIGKGAMGVVYLAFDPVIERQVAIKTMNDESFSDKEQRERFFREAKSAGGLQHPNIVTIYEMGEEDGVPYIVMEYVEGNDLDELIFKNKLNEKEKLSIMIQLCEALSFAHEKGIVHRDIKPSNIRVLKDNKVKVMDFGIAKRQDSDLTRTGLVVGTISYMSPEQIQGKPISAKSDQFSAGTVFYQLITGKKPFEGENITAVIFKIISLKPDAMDMTGVSVFISSIIKKMMSNKTEHRFNNCMEVADVLKSQLKSLSTGINNIKTEVINIENANMVPPLPIDNNKNKKPPSNRRKLKPNVKKGKNKTPIFIFLFIIIVAVFIGLVGFKKIKRFVKGKIVSKKENTLIENQTKKPEKNSENSKEAEKASQGNVNITDDLKPEIKVEVSNNKKTEDKLLKIKNKDKKPEKTRDNQVKSVAKNLNKDKLNSKDNEKKFNVNKKPLNNKEIFVKRGNKKVPLRKFFILNEFNEKIKNAKKRAAIMQQYQKKGKANMLFNQGRRFLGNKAYKAAALNFYMSTIFDSTNSYSYSNLIICLEKLKAYDEAYKALRQAEKHGVSLSEMMKNVNFKNSYENIMLNRNN